MTCRSNKRSRKKAVYKQRQKTVEKWTSHNQRTLQKLETGSDLDEIDERRKRALQAKKKRLTPKVQIMFRQSVSVLAQPPTQENESALPLPCWPADYLDIHPDVGSSLFENAQDHDFIDDENAEQECGFDPSDKIKEYLQKVKTDTSLLFEDCKGLSILPVTTYKPWIRPACGYLQIVRSSIHEQMNPDLLIFPDVFCWAPDQYLVSQQWPECPSQRCSYQLKPNGNQWTDPRVVHGIGGPIYLISRRYKCCNPQEAHYYCGSDPELLTSLPHDLELIFPFVVTKKSAVTKELAKFLTESKVNGLSLSGLELILNCVKNEAHDTKRVAYYAMCFRRQMKFTNGVLQTTPPPPQPFEEAKRIFPPLSDTYLGSIFNVLAESTASFKRSFTQSLLSGTKCLYVDHTFNVNIINSVV